MRTTRTRPLQTLYLEIVITSIAITQGFQFTLKVGSTKSFKQPRRTIQKKDLNDPDDHDGVITHLHVDILECKLKWALGSITRNKASGDDRISADLFQILKDDAYCTQYANKSGKLSSGHRTRKAVFIPTPKKGNAKECSNYCTISLISHARQ